MQRLSAQQRGYTGVAHNLCSVLQPRLYTANECYKRRGRRQRLEGNGAEMQGCQLRYHPPLPRQAGAGGTAPQSHAGELPWEWQHWSTRGWSMGKVCKAARSEQSCTQTGFPSGARPGIDKGRVQTKAMHTYTSSCRGNGTEHRATPVTENQQAIAALLNLPLHRSKGGANSSCPVPAVTALPAPPAAAPALTPSHSVLCIPTLSSSQLRNQFLQLRTAGGGVRIHPPRSALCFVPTSPSAPLLSLQPHSQHCSSSVLQARLPDKQSHLRGSGIFSEHLKLLFLHLAAQCQPQFMLFVHLLREHYLISHPVRGWGRVFSFSLSPKQVRHKRIGTNTLQNKLPPSTTAVCVGSCRQADVAQEVTPSTCLLRSYSVCL